MTTEIRLKPCPFCGENPHLHVAIMGEWWVSCEKCKSSSSMENSKDRAVTAWNTRTPAIDKEKLLKRLVNDLDVEFFEDMINEIESGEFDL